jgi:hypothetical protein
MNSYMWDRRKSLFKNNQDFPSDTIAKKFLKEKLGIEIWDLKFKILKKSSIIIAIISNEAS